MPGSSQTVNLTERSSRNVSQKIIVEVINVPDPLAIPKASPQNKGPEKKHNVNEDIRQGKNNVNEDMRKEENKVNRT